MGYPPLPLPRELPNGSQKAQPWITRIDPNHGQLGVTLRCLKRADGLPSRGEHCEHTLAPEQGE